MAEADTWRARLAAGLAEGTRRAFRPGVSSSRLARLEQRIELRVPSALAALLRETDGVIEERLIGGAWQAARAVVWTCDELEDINADSEDDSDGPWFLLFAGGAGGVLYAFAVDDSGEEDPSIYAWSPDEDAWRRTAASLEEHLRGWSN